jgi:hypothetical protein
MTRDLLFFSSRRLPTGARVTQNCIWRCQTLMVRLLDRIVPLILSTNLGFWLPVTFNRCTKTLHIFTLTHRRKKWGYLFPRHWFDFMSSSNTIFSDFLALLLSSNWEIEYELWTFLSSRGDHIKHQRRINSWLDLKPTERVVSSTFMTVDAILGIAIRFRCYIFSPMVFLIL